MLAWLLTTVTLLAVAGCSQVETQTFDPQRADVIAERGPARVATADALATVTGGRLSFASARIDSCLPGRDSWKQRDPWALRCHFNYATVLTVDDIATAATLVSNGLAAQGCQDPRQLSDQLAHWLQFNPGEPLPGDPEFNAAVVPPILAKCGDIEVWVRISSPDDALLPVTAAAAASTSDPVVVTARPFTAATIAELRTEAGGGVVIFVTARTLYHEEPR